MSITLPAFGETDFRTDVANKKTTTTVIHRTDGVSFNRYSDLFAADGYVKKQSYIEGTHRFSAFEKDGEGAFLNYYEGTRELYIVREQNCRYFDMHDTPMSECVTPQFTQIHLEDFGMSYVFRLSDGRFVIFDGGWEFEPDVDSLYRVLKEGSPYDKPIVAAWIMTHAHSDHFHAFIRFSEKYTDAISVQKVLWNFPDKDDTVHFPRMTADDARLERNESPQFNIPLLIEGVERFGAELVEIHSGQRFRIGDADFDILASMDDTLWLDSKNLNTTSLVTRVALGGQVILITADASCSDSAIAAKHGAYLKSDLMQVPHHGFGSGTAAAEIECYDLIKPSVCFLPVSDYNAYTCFSGYVKGVEYLMRKADIDELVCGDVTRTVTLPYTPPKYAKTDLERAFLDGRDDNGCKTWIFTELNTSELVDCTFTLLNPTVTTAVLSIDVFFEDGKRDIRYIKATVPPCRMKKINIFAESDVDGKAVYFNWKSLAELGVPENADFAVRFRSSTPIVVSNKVHKETFRSQNR